MLSLLDFQIPFVRGQGPEGSALPQPQELILCKNHPSGLPAPPSQRRAQFQRTPRPKPVRSTQPLRQSLALLYPSQPAQDSVVKWCYYDTNDLTETEPAT